MAKCVAEKHHRDISDVSYLHLISDNASAGAVGLSAMQQG
jgi:hypothetical protein